MNSNMERHYSSGMPYYQNYVSSYPANNYTSTYPNYTSYSSDNSNRFIGGGFLGPFILGGITGGLIAPAFYRPYQQYPYYYYRPY
jgi:hypothetical protein